MNYFSKPEVKESVFFKCKENEKIFSRKIKEYKKQEIKKELNNLYSQHCRAINQFKLIQKLEGKVKLDS